MRERAAVAFMAAGVVASIAGVTLLAGVAVGLIVLGVALVGLALVLGWSR